VQLCHCAVGYRLFEKKRKTEVSSSRFYISKKKILEDENTTLFLNVENNVRSDAEEWVVTSIMILTFKLSVNSKYSPN